MNTINNHCFMGASRENDFKESLRLYTFVDYEG